MPAAQQMQVEMVHRLPAFVSCVDDDSVTVVHLLFASDLSGRSHQVTDQGCVFGEGFGDRTNVLLGDDQDVGGGLRVDIWEAD